MFKWSLIGLASLQPSTLPRHRQHQPGFLDGHTCHGLNSFAIGSELPRMLPSKGVHCAPPEHWPCDRKNPACGATNQKVNASADTLTVPEHVQDGNLDRWLSPRPTLRNPLANGRKLFNQCTRFRRPRRHPYARGWPAPPSLPAAGRRNELGGETGVNGFSYAAGSIIAVHHNARSQTNGFRYLARAAVDVTGSR